MRAAQGKHCHEHSGASRHSPAARSKPMPSSSAPGPSACLPCSSWGSSTSRRTSSTSSTSPAASARSSIPRSRSTTFPGLPIVTGQELTDRLMEQIKPFGPQFHLGQRVEALSSCRDGRFRLDDRRRHRVHRQGRGDRRGRRLVHAEAAAARRHRGLRRQIGLLFRAPHGELPRQATSLIVGGGDSALDWTLNLQPLAKSLTLLHRRDDFRAAPHSVEKMRAAGRAERRSGCVIGQVTALHGEGGQLRRPRRSRPRTARSASPATPCCRSSG